MSDALQLYLTSPKVPSLPVVAMQVLELTRDENVDFGEMARVIENDQALSSKVLRTVNSSYYGLSKPCDSIKQAMVYLGINAVKTIVLGFSLVDAINGGDDEVVTFDYIAYWQQSLFSAVAAREIALKHRRCDPDVAFLGGLIGLIGQVAMFRVQGDRYLQALDMSNGDPRTLPNIEIQSFEISSAQVGAALAERWKFPDSLVQCIAHAQEPGEADVQYRDVVRTVGLAGIAARTILDSDRPALIKWMASNATRWFEFSGADLKEVMSAVKDKTGELASMFRIKNPEPAELDRLLHEAESQLAEVQVKLERENKLLRQRLDQLHKIARIDPAIEMPVRACLDEVLEHQFRLAEQKKSVFAVMLFAIDDFNTISNRLGGHDTNKLLKSIGKLLTDEISIRGIVTLYEDGQFAAVANIQNLAVATALAEHLRNEVRSLDDPSAKRIPITVSIGLTTYEPPLSEMINKPADLLQLVQRALDAATAAGTDCVRIFKPARRAA